MKADESRSARFAALGDPTRRTVLERVLRGPASVQEIADELPVSRPAVSQHLQVLTAADLVVAEQRGTRRYYRANADGLAKLHREVEGFWKAALNAYRDAAEEGAG